MPKISSEKSASGSKPIWLWALLVSLTVHFSLMAIAVSWQTPLPPKPKRVVPVEPISLTQVRPGSSGGGGGMPAPAVQSSVPRPRPSSPPVAPPKPKPRAKITKRVEKPAKTETFEPPPSLAIPRPAALGTLPDTGRTTASLGQPTGSSRGPGGTGGGPGGGSGSGTGIGQGPGSGAGSLLQGYLREVRRLLERQKEYPLMAQRLNIQGVVLLQFTITADGSIQSTRLRRSSGHGLLDEAAQETVRKVGRFPPLPIALGREKLAVEIPLAFRLKD